MVFALLGVPGGTLICIYLFGTDLGPIWDLKTTIFDLYGPTFGLKIEDNFIIIYLYNFITL